MTKKNPQTLHKFIVSLLMGVLLHVSNLYAGELCGQQCNRMPTCAGLGFKKNLNCPDGSIQCPFDASYSWCKTYTCEDGNYINYTASKSKSCMSVTYHGNVCLNCDCEGYNLDSCPENYKCYACQTDGVVKYKTDGCKDGYVVSGGSCVAKS